MSTETLPVSTPLDADDDGLDHYVCCDPDKALCGADVSGYDWVDAVDEPDDCVVCLDLRRLPCPKAFCRARMWWRERFGRRNWGTPP